MIAWDFNRDGCMVGNKLRLSYAALSRDWRCSSCGGRIVVLYCEQDGYYAACGRCKSRDFIHERELERQEAEAAEVLAALPAELAEALKAKGE